MNKIVKTCDQKYLVTTIKILKYSQMLETRLKS